MFIENGVEHLWQLSLSWKAKERVTGTDLEWEFFHLVINMANTSLEYFAFDQECTDKEREKKLNWFQFAET
jgi:hypothetical protein